MAVRIAIIRKSYPPDGPYYFLRGKGAVASKNREFGQCRFSSEPDRFGTNKGLSIIRDGRQAVPVYIGR